MLKRDDRREQESLREGFRVAGWLVQPRLHRMTDGARVVQAQPKIMDVLVALAESAGEVVTREQLFRTVWAGTHVTEHALSRSISELRKIFGDSHRRPRVVETIPKAGYRLIAPVVREPKNGDENPRPEIPTDDETTNAPPPSRRAARIWLGALSAATVLLTILFYLLANVRHIGGWHPHHH